MIAIGGVVLYVTGIPITGLCTGVRKRMWSLMYPAHCTLTSCQSATYRKRLWGLTSLVLNTQRRCLNIVLAEEGGTCKGNCERWRSLTVNFVWEKGRECTWTEESSWICRESNLNLLHILCQVNNASQILLAHRVGIVIWFGCGVCHRLYDLLKRECYRCEDLWGFCSKFAAVIYDCGWMR